MPWYQNTGPTAFFVGGARLNVGDIFFSATTIAAPALTAVSGPLAASSAGLVIPIVATDPVLVPPNGNCAMLYCSTSHKLWVFEVGVGWKGVVCS